VSALSVKDVLDSTGAVLVRGEVGREIAGVSTDTRSLRPRELFLALSGPNFDGNAFAAQACRGGAGALLLRGEPGGPGGDLPGDAPVALHPSPRRALADLAAWHRSRLAAPVIGVTGSCGKTTTKEILRQLLESRLRTVASPSSFNNDVGVPLTLLSAERSTEVLVVEIGTNAPGEIAALCKVARPTAGIITNVGASHLEGLGSLDGVAREKSELFASLPAGGFAVLNLDCRYAPLLRRSTRARLITVSIEGDGEFDATRPWFHSGGTTFALRGHEVTSPLLGLHNVSNLLCALAACHGLGIALEEVLPAVTRLRGGRRRMERIDLGDLLVFDDTYNANPESARAAVRVLAGLHAGGGRRVLALGDMLELGPSAPELHHALGREAAERGIDLVLLVGELTRATAAGALEAGMAPERVVHLGSAEEAIESLPPHLASGDVVLVKASRRLGLERVVERLVAQRAPMHAPRLTARLGAG
jgi:UDP-N-acetylmuramoyl-tripeptide--D-alanyl-D-alanine ligase